MTENPINQNEMRRVELDYRYWWNSLSDARRDNLNQVADQPEQAHQNIELWPISPHFFKDMFTAFALGDNTPRFAVFNFFDQAGREINNDRSRRRSWYRTNFIQGLEPFLSEHTHPFTQTRPAISTMDPDFASTKLLTWTTNIFDPSRSVNMRIREFNDLFLYDLKRYYQHNRNAFDFIDLAVTDFRQMLNLYRLEPNRPSWSERIRNFFFETIPATPDSPHETVTITPADTQEDNILKISYEDLGLTNPRPSQRTIPFQQLVARQVEQDLDVPQSDWFNFSISPGARLVPDRTQNILSIIENDRIGIEETVISFQHDTSDQKIILAFDKELDDHRSLMTLEFTIDRMGNLTRNLTPEQIQILRVNGVITRLQGLVARIEYFHRYESSYNALQTTIKTFGESLSKQL